jgi:predicted transcriptional regulator
MKKRVSEKRTQVYFPADLYRSLERRAKAEDKSSAQLIREAVTRYLEEQAAAVDWDDDPLCQAVGLFESAGGDLADRHDDYLYGPRQGPSR